MRRECASIYRANHRERARRARAARARHIVKCRIFIAGILAVTIWGAIFGTGVIRSSASATDIERAYKYYTDVVIACDYNLNDVAAAYADEHYQDVDDYLREVCSINHLTSAAAVQPGSHVIVPYYSTEFR